MVQIDLVRLVPVYAGIGGFATLTCGIFVTFLIEEELLCEAQSFIGTLCHRMKVFTFQLTSNIRLLREGG